MRRKVSLLSTGSSKARNRNILNLRHGLWFSLPFILSFCVSRRLLLHRQKRGRRRCCDNYTGTGRSRSSGRVEGRRYNYETEQQCMLSRCRQTLQLERIRSNGVTPLTLLRVPPEQNEVVYSPVERKVPHDAPLVFADLHCGFRCLAVICVAQIKQRSTLNGQITFPVRVWPTE